jgi:predicted nucleic acid-binding Zn ribbon protein
MSGLIDALSAPRIQEEAVEVVDDAGILELDADKEDGKSCRSDKCAEKLSAQESRKQKLWIVMSYMLVACLWLVLVQILGLAPWTRTARSHAIGNPLSWIVFFVPLFVFGLAIVSVWTSDEVCAVRNAVRGGNILYLGILVAIPLFTLLDTNYNGDRTQFALVVLASITCAVLGQLDVWGTARWTCIVHHVESALKTVSIGLLLFALVLYAFNGKYFSKGASQKFDVENSRL